MNPHLRVSLLVLTCAAGFAAFYMIGYAVHVKGAPLLLGLIGILFIPPLILKTLRHFLSDLIDDNDNNSDGTT